MSTSVWTGKAKNICHAIEAAVNYMIRTCYSVPPRSSLRTCTYMQVHYMQVAYLVSHCQHLVYMSEYLLQEMVHLGCLYTRFYCKHSYMYTQYGKWGVCFQTTLQLQESQLQLQKSTSHTASWVSHLQLEVLIPDVTCLPTTSWNWTNSDTNL